MLAMIENIPFNFPDVNAGVNFVLKLFHLSPGSENLIQNENLFSCPLFLRSKILTTLLTSDPIQVRSRHLDRGNFESHSKERSLLEPNHAPTVPVGKTDRCQ